VIGRRGLVPLAAAVIATSASAVAANAATTPAVAAPANHARSLALTGSPEVRALQITPQLTRYIGAWLPRRHQPNPAAEQLLAALRAHALAKPTPRTGHC